MTTVRMMDEEVYYRYVEEHSYVRDIYRRHDQTELCHVEMWEGERRGDRGNAVQQSGGLKVQKERVTNWLDFIRNYWTGELRVGGRVWQPG